MPRRQKRKTKLNAIRSPRGGKKVQTMTTPMVVSSHNKNYLLPPLCKGEHKFEDAMLKVSFIDEDEMHPYFPFPFYPRMCTVCAEIERP